MINYFSYEAATLEAADAVGRNLDLPKSKPVVQEKPVEPVASVAEKSVNEKSRVASDTPVYRESTTLEPQTVMGGSISNKKEESETEQKVRTKSRHRNKVKMQQVSVPRELISYVRHEFQDATNNNDALSAYMYLKSGKVSEAPDYIKDLIKNYDGDKTIINMEKRLGHLEANMNVLIAVLHEIELGMSFMAFDRKGFSKTNPKDARSIDYLESGVLDARQRLREQSLLQRREDNLKDGRPMR